LNIGVSDARRALFHRRQAETMTTKKQVKSLWSELLARQDDLFLADRFVILKPQRHVTRSISIDRSWDADYPRFCWHIGPAFDPVGGLGGLGQQPIFLERGKPNRWSQQGFVDTVFDALERRILPMLRGAHDIDDMMQLEGDDFEYMRWLNHDQPCRIAVLAAQGRFEDVLPICGTIKDWHLTMTDAWQPRFERASRLGALVAAGNRADVAGLLHQWEEAFVARNRLEPIYEKTPFPCEAGLIV
jgi:hypothetical protein